MDLVTMILACSLYTDNSITNAMIQVGSKNNPLAITAENDKTHTFPTPAEAADYANQQIQQHQTVDIGLMQVSSRWLEQYQATPADLVYSCKNIVAATKILNDAEAHCTQLPAASARDTQTCALSLYKTGDPTEGLDYANAVADYAAAHPFSALEAAAEASNPKGFHMLPGDAPTTASTINAAKINPATDPVKKVIKN